MIRKSFLSALILLNIGSLSHAMEDKTIQLPSTEKLSTYLYQRGFDRFVEKTEIVQDLGGRELYPSGVALLVETHLYDYAKYLQNPVMEKMMQMRKQQLIECILQDSPKEITEALIEQLSQDGAL